MNLICKFIFMQIKLIFIRKLLHGDSNFETEAEGHLEMAYWKMSIQLFRERLSVKSAWDNPERYCGFFLISRFLDFSISGHFEEMSRNAIE